MSAIKPTMKLVTAPWQDGKTFRLIPVTNDCPFSEGVYDPDSKVLVLMSRIRKESFHMMPKLDDNGDIMKTKTGRLNGKQYKEERKTLETFSEYYISEKEEIIEMLGELATNSDKYDYKQYMVDKSIIVPEKKKIELIK